MLNIGVLVSGGGTNLQVIIDRINDGYLKNCRIATVVSSKKSAYALERARQHEIPAVYIQRKKFGTLDDYDQAIIDRFEEHKVELVVMAGFLTILGKRFNEKYRNRILNVHPALIPSFCGKGYYGLTPHIKALEYGVKVTGATVHFAELETDTGPIILQKAIQIKEEETPESLQKRVMEECEQIILPEAIKLFSENKLVVEGRKVHILD